MRRHRHWSEYTMCTCGRRFVIGGAAEIQHRHNFPAMCRKRKPKAKKDQTT